MSLDLLSNDWSAPLTVSRTAAGTFDPTTGAWVAGSASTLTGVVGIVEDMTPEEVVALNLGERVKKAITIYTETQLVATSEALRVQGDRIIYGGDTYEVHTVAARQQIADLAHYEIVAFRVEGT